MAMSFDRYDLVRDRIIHLFNILNNRTYGVWLSPSSMLSLDALRNRETTVFEDSGSDNEYYSTPQRRQFKVRQLLPFLPNFNDHREIGFDKPEKSVVEIYESIQEYICLWTELMRDAPEFPNPPLSELRNLENLAYLIFPHYRRIKPMQNRIRGEEIAETDYLLNRQGLAGLSVIFSTNSLTSPTTQEEISFISYLDRYENKESSIITELKDPFPTLEKEEAPLGSWLFEGD